MLDEYRIEQMGVGAYVDSIDEEVITVDQAVQRAFCWSNEMINNLIYSTVSPKRIYIPNIILAEEKKRRWAYYYIRSGRWSENRSAQTFCV